MNKFSIDCCRHCHSWDVTWEVAKTNLSNVQDGRLCMHDVGISFFLACNTCSETLAWATEAEFLDKFNEEFT